MHIAIADAKAQFAALIRRAEAGEAITLTRHGKPVARLTAAEDRPTRPLIGALKGQVTIAPDFDAPLPDLTDALTASIDPT